MTRSRKARDRNDGMLKPFVIAAIVAVTTAAVVEDLRYFAEGSPESFLQTWRIQPVSMFIGSLVYVVALYLLHFLNDRRHAVKYVIPYAPLVALSTADLAIRLSPLWIAFVALVCVGCSILQVRFWHSS